MATATNNKILSGKHAFITGGSGGIGRACAKALLADGASVSLLARNQDTLNKIRDNLINELSEHDDCDHDEIAPRIHCVAADARDKTALCLALKNSTDKFGSLDIAIAVVGGGAIKPLLMHDESSFAEELSINIMSTFLLVRYAAPYMAKTASNQSTASIVCISSDAAKLVFPWLSAYTTAKSGLEGFVKAAAEELARLHIRVNAVRPGLTRTDATEAIFANPELKANFAAEKPLNRLGEPEDIAAGVRYLAGPESSWVTGQSFAIEGGNELRKAPDMEAMVRQIYGDQAFEDILKGVAAE